MTREEIRALIGGYATGSLTEAERNALFEAALDDQELFDELAREQELKAAIEMPGARERLLRSLEPNPATVWWRRPWTWAGAAAAALVVGFLLWPSRPPEVARLEAPRIESAPPKLESPAPAPAPTATAPKAATRRAAPARKAEPGPQGSVGGLAAPEVREQRSMAVTAGPVAPPVSPPMAAPPVVTPFAPQMRSLSGAISSGAIVKPFGFHYNVDWDRDVATVTADSDGYWSSWGAAAIACDRCFQTTMTMSTCLPGPLRALWLLLIFLRF